MTNAKYVLVLLIVFASLTLFSQTAYATEYCEDEPSGNECHAESGNWNPLGWNDVVNNCQSTCVQGNYCYYNALGCKGVVTLLNHYQCAYESKVPNPGCNPYASGNTCYYNGANSCGSSGWSVCSYANQQALDLSIWCPGGGATCTNSGWNCPGGCTKDSDCGTEAGTNRLGKCVGGSCSYGPCGSNAECGSGYCCDRSGPGGEGNCIAKGIYSGNAQWLCDPPDWIMSKGVETQSEQPKNIIRKIFDIFLAL